MALIKCPECGKEFSDKAESCPHCGHPSRKGSKKSNKSKKIIAVVGAVVVIAVVAGGAWYYNVTTDQRAYAAAMDDFEDEKFDQALEGFNSLGNYRDAQEMADRCEYELSTDGQFLRAVADGLEERWGTPDEDYPEANQNNFGDGEIYERFCDIELKHVEPFYDKKFNDEELQKDARAYIDSLRKAKDATVHFSSDFNSFYRIWNEAYDERTLLINKFVNDYGIQIDDKYQEILDDTLTDASSKQKEVDTKTAVHEMVDAITIEVTDEKYGVKSYKATVSNTTGVDVSNLSVTVNLLDQNGNIVGNGTVSVIPQLKAGQTATVDAYFTGNENPSDYTLDFVPHYQAGTYYE